MSRTFVVGTAGHVDHGKSSLVRVLTGTDPDRLAEEQRRQMTIDLGFAELVTPAGNRVHIVDVPGHERFVRNMLAGAAGIDAAIIVIAADDGPMPQTREHLAILELLGIEHGIVALTKTDLVDDEWIDLVTGSVRELLGERGFGAFEVVPVSSTTGAGLWSLVTGLDRMLEAFDRPVSSQPARLPIDRVFSMSGFGTVVTGTLAGSPLSVGDRVELLPNRRSSRVRGLQTFGELVETALPGSRVAVNLIGLETEEIARGDVLALPGAVRSVMRVDARMHLLASSERPVDHNDEVLIFAGAAEVPARIALLESSSLQPSSHGWAQFRFSRPMVLLTGDRFIVRRPSPPETIGGGVVVELDPPRHKQNQVAVLERLTELAKGDPADRMLAWIGTRFADTERLADSPFGAADGLSVIEQLVAGGRLLRVGRWVATPECVEATQRAIEDRVAEFHQLHPLEPGLPREALRESLQMDRVLLETLLGTSPELQMVGPLARRSDFRIQLDPERQTRADAYLARMAMGGFQPATPEEAGIGPDLARAMANLGWIVEIGDGIAFLPERLSLARVELLDVLAETGSISLAEYRDRLGTTRRYAQALLEYFDRQRVTRRTGDRRVAIGPIEHGKDETAK